MTFHHHRCPSFAIGSEGHVLFALLLVWITAETLAAVTTGDKVKHFTYEILETVNHPPRHFTQGFTFRQSDGALIEGTGLEGSSVIALYGAREDGTPTEPRFKVDVPNNHFGEGIAELLGKLYQLTWKNGKVHVWNADTLEHIETRAMPRGMVEGWGLATAPGHDALIMSEGSAKLFWVVPDATPDGGFMFRKELVVKDCQNMPRPHILGGLNELETVPLRVTHPEEVLTHHTSEGAPNFEQARPRPHPSGATIWANIYGSHCVAVIDPVTGNVKAYIHLDGLNPSAGEFNQVTNGVAFRDEDDSLWVTGKNWDKMFKIKLKEIEKPPAGFPRKCQTSWAYPGGVNPKERYPQNVCDKPRRTEL